MPLLIINATEDILKRCNRYDLEGEVRVPSKLESIGEEGFRALGVPMQFKYCLVAWQPTLRHCSDWVALRKYSISTSSDTKNNQHLRS